MAKGLEVIDGVEVGVETGTGILTALDTTRRNWGCSFAADHVNLKKPVNGWLDPGVNKDSALAAVATEVHAKALRVAYRIEIRRKPDQRTDVPLAEIANFDRLRDVTDLVPIGDQGGVPASWSRPASSGPAPAAQQAPAGPETEPPAHDDAPPPQEAPGGDQEPPDDAPPPDDGDAPPSAAPTGSRDGKRGPRIEEAKPWQPYNTDGELNLGSYAVQGVEGLVLLAHDLLLARARFLAQTEGKPPVDPTPGQLRGLARRLLEAADRIQASVRSDGHFDRMDGSHTRSRAAMRSALEAHPVPWGVSTEELDAWQADVVTYGSAIMGVVIELVEHKAPG